MDKKQLNRIITLYREGLSEEFCITCIIDTCLRNDIGPHQTAIWIHQFYNTLFDFYLKQETAHE